MNKEVKPTNDFLKAIIIVVLTFFGFELVTNFLGSIVAGAFWKSLITGKYGRAFISECAVLIFAIGYLLIRRKWSIFKKKKWKLKESIELGVPIIVLSLIMLFVNIPEAISSNLNVYNLISLVFYCVSIGFFEEIVYRGIIEGELLERFSNTKIQAFISIGISALIFGIVHITNMFYGQDLFTTIMQVIQTISIGILFGSIYYVTRNIWSLIFLHGFYDFAVILSDVNLIKDCGYTGAIPLHVMFQSIVVSLILSGIYILYSLLILKDSNINPLLNKETTEEDKQKEKKMVGKVGTVIWALIIGFFGFNAFYGSIFENEDASSYYTCYDYPEKELKNIETHYFAYDEFKLAVINNLGEHTEFAVYKENDRAIIKNQFTGETLDLGIDDVYRVVAFDNKILIIATDYVDFKLYYNNYLTSDNASNTNEFLNNLKKSFKSYDMPSINALGYLVDGKDGKKYPMVRSTTNDIFIINEDKVELIKEK